MSRTPPSRLDDLGHRVGHLPALEVGVEDLYFIASGDGWAIVDDEPLPLRPGLFVAVSVDSTRQIRAGASGLSFVALCGAPR